MSVEKFEQKSQMIDKPSREEAEGAVETLLRWIGEDPSREGLRETPARYVRAFDEFFKGYNQDPAKELQKTFEDIEDYDDFVLVKNIEFVSHCEHHIVPIIGKAHVAYWPDKKVVGISKLARIVDIYAHRLTSQENMTRDIAEVITNTLNAKGAAVMIDANHQCMSTRGVNKMDSSTVTSHFTGCFKKETDTRQRFLENIK
jgi:GTP cyclohydrolase I